jgi:hypothetical protein
MENLTQEERTAKDISALEDSVWVIDQMLATEPLTEESLATINRNVEHIELMLTKDHILESGTSLVPFQEAVSRARA